MDITRCTFSVLAACAVALCILSSSWPGFSGELRVLDPQGKEDSSPCIGDPRTPVCAVDTFKACDARGDKAMCRSVGFDYDAVHEGRIPAGYGLLYYYRYRLLDQWTIAEDQSLPSLSWMKGWRSATRWRAGDVVVRLRYQSCPPDDACVMRTINDPNLPYGLGCRTFDRCEWNDEDSFVVTRRAGTRWIVIGSYSSDWLPPALRNRK